MKAFLFVLCGLLLSVLTVSAENPKGENKKLEGTWKVVSAEVAGKKAGAKEFGIDQVIIKDDKLIFQNEGKDLVTFGLATDATKKPRTMEWIKLTDKSSLPGIYTLEGDELRICTPLVPKDPKPGEALKRPEGFETADKPLMLMVLKRAKS